jgi:hypothetical protein
MSNAIYPSLIHGFTYTFLKTPEFATIVQKSPNGYETRIAQMQNPLWHFTLVYDYLYDHFPSQNNTMPYTPYTDLATLMGFFLARQGQNDSFLFTDPTDSSVGPAMLSGSPNLQTQLPLVADSSGVFYSPIQRNIGGLFKEDISDLNGLITVYANGVLQAITTNYTIGGPGLALPGASYAGLYLKWVGTPTGPITVQFNFYYRVRFETDSQDFENWMAGLWTIGGGASKSGSGVVKLMSSRPGAAPLILF